MWPAPTWVIFLKTHNSLSVHTSGPHVPDRERFIAEILIDQQHPPLALSDIISLPPPCFAQLSSFAPQDPSDVWHMSDRGRLLSGLIREEQSTWRGTCEPFPRPSPPLKAPSAGQSITGLTTGRPWKCFSPICPGLAKPSSLPPPLPWLSPGWQEPRWNPAVCLVMLSYAFLGTSTALFVSLLREASALRELAWVALMMW